MFMQTVIFKRNEGSEWEKGFYIGRYDNDSGNNSTFLDNNYQPLPKNKDGFQVWESHYDLDRAITLSIPIINE